MTTTVHDVIAALTIRAAVISAALGGTVDVHVSYRRTDPWTIGLAQPAGRSPR